MDGRNAEQGDATLRLDLHDQHQAFEAAERDLAAARLELDLARLDRDALRYADSGTDERSSSRTPAIVGGMHDRIRRHVRSDEVSPVTPTHDILAGVQRRRRVIIQGFLWTLLALVALAILLSFLLSGSSALRMSSLLPNLAFLGVIGVALWLNHRHRFRAALGIVIALTLFFASLAPLLFGVGASAATLFVFFIPVTLAGLLLDRAALRFTSGWSLLVVLGAPFLERSGLLPSGAPPAEPAWDLAWQFALVLGAVSFFLDRFGTTLQDALVAMAEREAALQREVEGRRRAEERLGLALSAAGMATYDVDLTTSEVRGSSGLEALYGLPATGRGRPLEEFLECIHPEDRGGLVEAHEVHRVAASERRDELRVLSDDGDVRWLATVSKTVVGEDGAPERVAGVVLDVTDVKTAQRKLQEMNVTLEQRVQDRTVRLSDANRELETFAYSISHDLRAPLRGIHGFSQALVEDYGDALDDTARGYLARVQAGANRMGELIDDLLEFSRLSRREVQRTRVDLGGVASEIARELNEGRPERPLAFEAHGDLVVQGDAHLLRIVLENLLGNAWKFMGDQAEPRVEFGTEGDGGSEVFFVRDNGVGFDPAYADKLFAPFQRLHSPEEFEGTGIGLATVQRIIHRHGGRIWAEGAPGEGATFRFTLDETKERPGARAP